MLSLSFEAVSKKKNYLCKSHTIPLVRSFLRAGGVHQLEARLILLVEIRILTPATEL